MKKIFVIIAYLLCLPMMGFADTTCTVPTDGTIAQCAVILSTATGVATMDIVSNVAKSDFSMALWTASSTVIKGQGHDTTTVSGNWTITTRKEIPVEIKDLKFTGNTIIRGEPRRFLIHDNNWSTQWTTLNVSWTAYTFGVPYGVIYKNHLQKINIQEAGVSADNRFDYIHQLFRQEPPFGAYGPTAGLGSDENGIVYIEGNDYPDKGVPPISGTITDGVNAMRTVFRYNTITASSYNQIIEFHSIQNNGGGPQRGSQIWEVYNNLYTAAYTSTMSGVRAGTGIWFNNGFTIGSGSDYGVRLDNVRSNWSSADPVHYSGWCNGSGSWDGNLTIDHDQPSLVTWYSNTGVHDPFTGTHDGANNAATLSDSTKNWVTNHFIEAVSHGNGATVYNVTDGSKCAITANDATTLTCTLTGGTDNDWDAGDSYRISDGYPCRDQIGHTYLDDAPQFDNYDGGGNVVNNVQPLKPMYVWNNQRNGTANNIVTVIGDSGRHIINNRDYFTQQGASCTAGGACTAGVGTGTTLPTSCTLNTGFWKTSSKILYKCTNPAAEGEAKWTAFWAEPTCPHPLTRITANTCDSTIFGATGYATGEPPAPVYHTLTVTIAGGGSGSGESTPAGINYATSLSHDFEENEVVTLPAPTVDANNTNGGWSAGCTGTGSCVVTMTADQARTLTITPVAPPESWNMTVRHIGTGSGTSDPVAGDTVVVEGTSKSITATPVATSTLTGYSGSCGCTGAVSPCTINPFPENNCEVIIEFTDNPKHDLIVTAGNGVQLISSGAGQINCGVSENDCVKSAYEGTDVTLTGWCQENYYDLTWDGDGVGTTTRIVTMSAVQEVSSACYTPTLGNTTHSGAGRTMGSTTDSGAGVTLQ